MKLLYIASERRDAQLLAETLRRIAPTVRMTWSGTLAPAFAWVQEHREVLAVIAEAEIQGQSCASFVDHVRRAGIPAPVVVVTKDRQPPPGVHADYLVSNQSLLAELPAVISHALQRTNSVAPPAATPRPSSVGETTGRVPGDERSAAGAGAAADMFRLGELERRLAEEMTQRQELHERLTAAESALQQAEQRNAKELAAAAARLADTEAQHRSALGRAANLYRSLEQRALDLETALRHVEDGSMSHSSATVDELTQRNGELTTRLRELAEARDEIAKQLAATAAALDEARKIRQEEAAVAAERLGRREAELAEQLAATAAARSALEQERRALQQSLEAAQQDLQQLREAQASERQQYERSRAVSESERRLLMADAGQLRLSLDQLRAAHDTLEETAGRHAAECIRLETAVRERDAQLTAQGARHRAALEAAKVQSAEMQATLSQALDETRREITALQREIDSLRRDLAASRAQADALQRQADRVPVLRQELEQAQNENRQFFERAPYGICRCDSAGAVIDANRALVRLLGYRNADALRKADFARSIFESPVDLHWLIDRALRMRATEWVEAAWKDKNHRRLIVRLQLQALPSGLIDIVIEDLTPLRAAEERLRRAQRMEAVGRVASEVAATCEALLRDVRQDGQEWLAAMSDTAARYHGESLLAEVARAAGFMRQLGVYGDEQVRALEAVSLRQVLLDLQPVLKRVIGDGIQLVLPPASASIDDGLEVDVEVERVERLFVNVASYARERMSKGGRLQIELDSTVLGSNFVAEHPSVRPGPHALITITGVAGTSSSAPVVALPGTRAGEAGISVSDKPGVDVGALLTLIGDSGGHLWMNAGPDGNMTLKIHLPKRQAGEDMEPRAAVPLVERGRSLVKWLRHGQTAG